MSSSSKRPATPPDAKPTRDHAEAVPAPQVRTCYNCKVLLQRDPCYGHRTCARLVSDAAYCSPDCLYTAVFNAIGRATVLPLVEAEICHMYNVSEVKIIAAGAPSAAGMEE
jgi:hypothetical protein